MLGIAGAFLATFIGQAAGWYRADQGAGFVEAIVGAVVVLSIWNRLVAARTIRDPGIPHAFAAFALWAPIGWIPRQAAAIARR